MKILIVDDEAVSRIKLEAVFGDFGECRAVAGGREAVAEVKNALVEGEPYNLITMDIGMPDMDGTEALFEIRKLEKQYPCDRDSKARVIMITAQNDRDSLITCVKAGCDDYIIKPVDPDLVIQRLLALKIHGVEEEVGKRRKQILTAGQYKESDRVAIGKEVLSLFKRGEISLPSPSSVYKEFKKMIERGADIFEMTGLLKEDIGLSFHLISVSNSPVYRGVKENRNLQQAIGRLGLELTARYVEILGNRSLFTVANEAYQPIMDNLWEHSAACANAAELLADEMGLELAHDPFTLGILHDVGKMVLIQIVSELEARGKIGVDVNRANVLNTLTEYHGPFGQAVLNQWNFPREFGEAAKMHDDLEKAYEGSKELLVVQLANLISKSMGYGCDEIKEVDLLECPPAKVLGVDAENLEAVKSRLGKLMAETLQAFEK